MAINLGNINLNNDQKHRLNQASAKVNQIAQTVTTQAPTASAYQQNLAQPLLQEKWYKGDTPTTREIYGRIATIGEQDRNAGNGFMQQFQTMQSTPGSQYYNAYLKPTNPAVANLNAMGVDTSNLDDEWFNQNSYLQQYYILGGTTNTPQKPGKKATPEQLAAYEYYQLSQQRDNTDSYLQENAALKQELAYQATRPDRNWTDEEIVNNINWDKYPTLKKMRQSRETGVPIELNVAAPGYTDDWCYGSIWAARNNGGTGDWQADMAMSYLGRGNVYQENPEMRTKLDATSDDYAPYSVGSTLEDEMLYFGRDSFDQQWLDDNRWMLNSNDETQKRMYQNVYNAELKTQELETQRTAMDNQIGELLKQSNDPDYILKRLKGNSDYSGLWAMDDSLGDAKLIDTTRAVDYRWKDVENEVRADCALNAMGQTAGGFAANLIGTLTGAVDPSVGTVTRTDEQKANDVEAPAGNAAPKKTTEQALEEQQNANLSLASQGIIDYGTDAEKRVFTAGRSAGFDTLAGKIAEMNPKPEACLQVLDDGFKSQIAGNYMENRRTVGEFDKETATIEALKERQHEISLRTTSLEARYNLYNEGSMYDIENAKALKGSDIWETALPLLESDDPGQRWDGLVMVNRYMRENNLTSEELDMGLTLNENEDNCPETMQAIRLAVDLPEGSENVKPLTDDELRDLEGYHEESENIENELIPLEVAHDMKLPLYQDATAEMKGASTAYKLVGGAYALNGQGYEEGLLDDLDLAYLYGDAWTPTNWTPNTVYDMAVADGTAREEVTPIATKAATGNLQMEKQLLRVLERADKYGIPLTDKERRNITQGAAELHNDAVGAGYFLLDDMPDFTEQANAGHELALSKDNGFSGMTNMIIRYMNGGDKLDGRMIALGADSLEYDEMERLFYGQESMALTSQEERDAWIRTAFNVMTDEEKNRYYYLLKTEGEDAANEYFAFLADEQRGSLQVRASEERSNMMREGAGDNLMNTIAGSFLSFASNVTGNARGWLMQTYGKITGQEISPYNIAYADTMMTQDLRQGAKDLLTSKNPGNAELITLLYDSLMSAGDSYINAQLVGGGLELLGEALPFIGKFFGWLQSAGGEGIGGRVLSFLGTAANDWIHALPMAMGAAMQTYREWQIRGADPDQCKQMYYSTLFAESVSEAITYGNIKDMYSLGEAGPVKGFFRQFFENSFDEFLGEGFNQWWEQNAETIIMGEMSEYQALVDEYMETYPEPVARMLADRQMTKNILMAGAAGFISSGFSSTGGYVTGKVQSGNWTQANRDIATRDLAVLNSAVASGSAYDTQSQRNINSYQAQHGRTAGPQNNTNAALTISSVMRSAVENVAADATSQRLVADVCEGSGQQAAQMMQGLIMAAGDNNTRVKQAVAYAALTDGNANRVLQDIAETAKNGDMISEEAVNGLLEAVEQDQNGENAEALQGQYDGAIRESRIAAKVRDAMAVGEVAEKFAQMAATVNQKQDNLDRVKGEQQEAQAQLEAAQGVVQSAAEEQANNPTPETNGPLEQSLNQLEGADTQLRQKNVEVENAEQAVQEAKTEWQRQVEQKLTELRAEAAQAVEQEDQQAAVEARQNQQSESVNEANQEADTAEAELGNVMPAQQEQATGEQTEGQTEQAPQSEAEQRLNTAREQLATARQELEAAQQANDGSDEAMDRVDRAADEVKRIAKEIRENELTGKAIELDNEQKIDRWLDERGLQGQVREDLREKLLEYNKAKAAGTVDMSQKVSNVEGLLAVVNFGRQLGLNVKLDPKLGNARGRYKNGTIYLNQNMIQSGNMTVGQALIETCLHEITHSMQDTKSYGKYSKLVKEILFRKADGSFDENAFQAAVDQKIAEYKNNLNETLTPEQAEQEIVADFARTSNLHDRDVIARFLDAGLAGQMRNTLHNINQMLKNYKLTGQERIDKENLRKAERLYQKALNEVARKSVHPEGEQFSVMQFAQSAGLRFDEQTLKMYDQSGKEIDGVNNKVTSQMMEQTPVGMLIREGLSSETYTDKDGKTHNVQQEALDMMTDLMNMIARYKDSNLVWEIGASTLSSTFSALKSNSDTQYKTTVDFGTVCAKTQAIIDVMSDVMLNKIDPETGKIKDGVEPGLTREDVIKVYNATHDAGLSVPCPVCYVFSRWMGVPSLLGQMSKYQSNYVVTNEDGSINKEATQAKVDEYIANAQQKYGDAKAINNRKARLQSQQNDLEQRRIDLEKSLYQKGLTEEEKANIQSQIDETLGKMVDIDNQLGEVSAYNWITQALCKQDKATGKFVIDPKFKVTPDAVLFDLNRTAEFAEYEKNWAYRNTRGAGMGKAIMPYSGETIGDILYGVKKGGRQSTLRNPWLNMDSKSAQRQLKDAIKRARQQNLLGGQRLQSTSDFRPEWGLDYIMSFLELQAAKSKVQMYTKVGEAVDFFASMGADVNLSIMGKNSGYHEATAEEIAAMTPEQREAATVDGKVYVMDFSDVTGMNYGTALDYKNKYDNVQMILVGMNDIHVRLALQSNDIDFVIPWHSSGNSKDVLSKLIDAVHEKLMRSSDYTSTQSDSVSENQTEEQKAKWNARMKILTGKANNAVAKGGFTESERTMVYGDQFLNQLYQRFYVEGVDADCYGVKLSAAQAGQIFPYEYWDTTLTKKDADQNGKRFVDYCESMGIVPRFSQFKDVDGYWKLLIDRSMYDNNGDYRSQQVVDVTQAKIGALDENGKLTDSDLPTQAQAKYAPKDPRNARYNEYTAAQQKAVMNAEAMISEQYDDGTDGNGSVYGGPQDGQALTGGEMTDADAESQTNGGRIGQENFGLGINDQRGIEGSEDQEFRSNVRPGRVTDESTIDNDGAFSTGGDLTDADMDRMLAEAGITTGRQLEGENPLATSAAGGPQRQFGSRTAQNSDELGSMAKQYLLENSSYIPETNAEQLDRAINWVAANGLTDHSDGLYESIMKLANNNFDYRSADGQARMVAMMGMAVAKGDAFAQMQIADAFNRQGTDLGRALQARKLFRLMTPEGRTATLTKMLEDVKNDIESKSGKNVDLKFSDFVLQAAAEASTSEEFDQVRKAAAKELGAQLPVNWKDKLTGWRMLSMLGNPRTHIRNIFGNFFFMGPVAVKNKLGALMELTQDKSTRTKTLGLASSEARAFAKQDALTMRETLTGEAKYSDGGLVQQSKRVFKSRILNRISDFNSEKLEQEDWLFLNRHYRNALAGYMTARGLTAEQMKGKTLDDARAYAINEAQKATYRDANKLASDLSKIGRNGGPAGFFVNAVLPFKKTPANILRRGVEYSPVGLLKALSADAYHLHQYNKYQRGELNTLPAKAISATQWIDKFASGLTGTAIAALGLLFRSAGFVNAGLDDDDDEFEKLRGKQEYSMNILGQNVTIDWAAPACMPFFVGATIFDVIQKANGGENIDPLKIAESLIEISEPVFNLSMLEGVNNLFDVNSYGEGNALTQIGLKIISNYMSSYVPTFAGQVARTADPTRRKSYVPTGTAFSTFAYMFEQVQNKLPYLSTFNIPYRDVWGNETTKSRVGSGAENFLSPAYWSELKDDDLVNELERLYQQTGSTAAIPKMPGKTIGSGENRIVLTDQQYDQLTVERGTAARTALDELITRPEWLLADDETKADMIGDVWTYANQRANYIVSGGTTTKAAWVEAAENGNPVDAVVERAVDRNKSDYVEGHKTALIESIDSGNSDDALVSITALREAGKDDSSIRSTLTNHYKPIYQQMIRDGKYQEADILLNDLYDLDIGFKDSTLNKWSDFDDEEEENALDLNWLNRNNR